MTVIDQEMHRTQAIVEAAVLGCDQDGGDIRQLAYSLLRASSHLFAEVFDADQLAQAATHLCALESARKNGGGRA